jgi:hypothetical protein
MTPPAWTLTDLAKLPILSIRQPWAWAILHAGKDFENRNWSTSFRGQFLIHASKACTRDEYDDACSFMVRKCGVALEEVPSLKELDRGGIIGVAKITDCVSHSSSS